MRRRPSRPSVLAAGLGLATITVTAVMLSSAATPTLAAGAAAGRAAVLRPPAAGITAASGPVTSLLLINGDRLLVRPQASGGQATAVVPGPGSSSMLSLRAGGQQSEIPADALPYLGRGLSPGLFELSALERAESGGRLHVRVTFSGRRPSLTGVTVTRAGARSASGYLTASSAQRFGAALARQFRADHARGSYGIDGMFAGGTSITLAGAPVPARARPDFPMHTLTITGTSESGQPDTGDQVLVFDLGDQAVPRLLATFYHGVAKLSVPGGSYWAAALMGTNAAPRVTVLPQFAVHAATTVHVAARAATSKITVVTTRPAVSQTVGFTVVRRLGRHVTTISFDDWPALYISPVPKKPVIGTLQAYAAAQLASPARAAGTPYAYDLAFADPPGTIPAQSYAVAPDSLATVRQDFYQAVPSTGGWGTDGGYAAQDAALVLLLPRRNSGRLVQYLTGGPDVAWASIYTSFYAYGWEVGGFQSYAAGEHVTQDWDQYPLHPALDVQLLHGALAAAFPVLASAVRSGNELSLAPNLFSDNQPGHKGVDPDGPDTKLTGSWEVGQDGRKIGGGSLDQGNPVARLSPRPSVITFRLATARRDPYFPLSTRVTTTWTWHSRPRPSATVPGGWYCGFSPSFQLLRRCAVQPLLTLGYHVHGMSAAGQTLAGPQVIGLDIGHLQLTAASPATRATAQVSFSDGRAWLPATITAAGHGQFRVTFTAPARADVTLRVSAADAAGSTVTETILRAYAIAPSAGSH